MLKAGDDQMDKRKRTNQLKPSDEHEHQEKDESELATYPNAD